MPTFSVSLALLATLLTTALCIPTIGHDAKSGPTAPTGTFDFDNVFPKEPASSVKSLYKATDELMAWSDIALFNTVAQLLQVLPSNSGGLYKAGVIMAPTNAAFVSLILELYPELTALGYNAVPFLSNATAVEEFLKPIESLFNGGGGVDAIQLAFALNNVINYHLIGDELSEPELKNAGSVTSLAGLPLDMSAYPDIKDFAGKTSTRYARMIDTTDANIIVIDRVLLPGPASEIRKVLPISVDMLPKPPVLVPTPEPKETDDTDNPTGSPGPFPDYYDYYNHGAPYTPVFSRVSSFVKARSDLSIFNLLADQTYFWYSFYDVTPHIVVPNNNAFIKLFGAIVPDLGKKLEGVLKADTPDPTDLPKLIAEVTKTIGKISSLPSLEDILSYHAIAGSASLEARVDKGEQETLFGNAKVTVTQDGDYIMIDDLDPTRTAAKRIATFTTQGGYVSVIDGVLAPFDTSIAAAVILSSEDSPLKPDGDEPLTTPEDADGNSLQGKSDDGECFPADAEVHTAGGRTVAMRDLQGGDTVRVHTEHDTVLSPVFLFTHRDTEAVTEFVRIETEGGHVLRATAGHYVYAGGKLRAMGTVRVGDVVETVDGDSTVKGMARVVGRGLYAPHSLHGDLVVDGIRVSSYSTAVHPKWAHALLAPVRLASSLLGVREPLGPLFYRGAERLVGILPRGQEAY